MQCVYSFLRENGDGYMCLHPHHRGDTARCAVNEQGEPLRCTLMVAAPVLPGRAVSTGRYRFNSPSEGTPVLDIKIDRHRIMERIVLYPESSNPVVVTSTDTMRRLRDGLTWALGLTGGH